MMTMTMMIMMNYNGDDDDYDDDWQRATQGPDQTAVVMAPGETDHTLDRNIVIVIVNIKIYHHY